MKRIEIGRLSEAGWLLERKTQVINEKSESDEIASALGVYRLVDKTKKGLDEKISELEKELETKLTTNSNEEIISQILNRIDQLEANQPNQSSLYLGRGWSQLPISNNPTEGRLIRDYWANVAPGFYHKGWNEAYRIPMHNFPFVADEWEINLSVVRNGNNGWVEISRRGDNRIFRGIFYNTANNSWSGWVQIR